MKPWQLTKEDVEQIWAEVLVLVDGGEKLYLDSDLEACSQANRRPLWNRMTAKVWSVPI
jgi:putative DNA primase/helicase